MAERDDQGDLPDDDLDARWAALVADLEGTGSPAPRDPDDDSRAGSSATGSATSMDDPTEAGLRPPAVTYPVAPWVRTGPDAPGPVPTGPVGPRDWDEDEDGPEAHFVPADPGPVVGGDPLLTLAWVAVLGPLLLALVVAVAWRSAPVVLLQAAGIVLAAGLGVLVWRMPAHRRIDDGPSDGARV